VTDVIFLALMAVLLLFLQTTSLAYILPAIYKPDLIVTLVVWSGMRIPFTRGIGSAFGIGLVVDLFSGSYTGLFATIYTVVYVAAGYLHEYFRIDTRPGGFLCTFCATLMSGVMVLGMRVVTGPVEWGKQAAIWFTVKALATALASLVVFPFIERSWAGYCRLVGVRQDSGMG
jgi:rod shape-determining protein MreD